LTAAWEYVTEKVPFEAVFKPSKHLLRKMLKIGTLEAAQEFVQGIGENFLEYFGYTAKDLDTVPAAVKEGLQHTLDGWVENIVAGFGLGIIGAGVVGRGARPTPEAAAAPVEAELAPTPTELPSEEVLRPELLYTEPITEPTRRQKQKAHILAREQGLTDTQRRELAEQTTGVRSMSEMSREQADDFIKRLSNVPEAIGLTTPEETSLRKTAQTKEVFQDTIEYAKERGGLPQDIDQRKDFIRDLNLIARKKRRKTKRRARLEYKGKEVNVLNPFSSIRYALGELESWGTKPLRSLYSKMVAGRNRAGISARNRIMDIYKRLTTTPFRFSITPEQNRNIAKWLYSEDADVRNEVWSKLDPQTQALAQELRTLFQTEGAEKVRAVRFMIWDLTGERPPDVSSDNAKRILAEGRTARDEGRFAQWIKDQTWGAREFYYMSERQAPDLADDIVMGLMPSSLIEKAGIGKKPPITPSEARTRKAPSVPVSASVINNTLRHLTRLNTTLEIADNLYEFWNNFEEINPSPRDVDAMREFISNIIGRARPRSVGIRVVQKAQRLFWRFHFLNPTKGLWFAYRNLHQNLAYAITQISPKELVLSVKDIIKEKATGKTNQQRTKDFADTWKTQISQKLQLHREAILLEEGNATTVTQNKIVYLADQMGSMAILSDEGNRLMVWPLL
ncbi:hypothetical protein LCGC14_2106760, partial [marine sediment metagenome]